MLQRVEHSCMLPSPSCRSPAYWDSRVVLNADIGRRGLSASVSAGTYFALLSIMASANGTSPAARLCIGVTYQHGEGELN